MRDLIWVRLVSGALVLIGLGACSAVTVRMPNPRVEAPELRGERGIKIEIDSPGAHTYRLTEDGSNRPPDVDHPTTETSQTVNSGFFYSPDAPIEFGGEIDPLAWGLAGVVRWQPLGKGTRGAEEGNIPLMVYARGGTTRGSVSGDQKGTFGPGGYNWNGSISGAYLHTGISTGYRMNPHALFYAGGALGQYWLKGEVNQDATSTDAAASYVRSDRGHAETFGIGFLFNWPHFQFSLGGDYTHLDYAHTRQQEDPYFHVAFYITPK